MEDTVRISGVAFMIAGFSLSGLCLMSAEKQT